MSIPVDIGNLAAAIDEYGAGYLLTASTDGSVKAVTVEPTIDPAVASDALLIGDPGGGSRSNIASNATVTVLFPPLERHGYTLIIDGTASIDEVDPDHPMVAVAPTRAVLHRPAAHADGPAAPGGCGHDCVEV